MDLITFFNIALGATSPLLWFVRNETAFRLLGAAIPLGWSILNYTQGLLDSALILFVISIRALVGLALINQGRTIKTFFVLIFVFFFTVMLFQGYQDYYSLLPWFAACLTTVAQLYLTGVKLRMTQSIGADGAWVVYDLVREVWGHLFEKSAGILINAWTVHKMIKSNSK